MPIIACGINHKTAPIALREQVIFAPEKIGLYLQDLGIQENVREAVLLSTCNRSEVYCDVDDPEKIRYWFSRQHHIDPATLEGAWYCHTDQKAVEHIMQVACGLDSMVLGEPQILGQMKDAFSESCAAGVVGPQFNRLFQHVFAVAKEVRTTTAIGACPVSLASAAVNLAKEVATQPLADATILLIGAGDTIQLILRYLQTQAVKKIIIANRQLEHAVVLAAQCQGDSIALTELPTVLSKVDWVFSATGSALPIVDKSMLSACARPLVMVDLAVPRDIAEEVATLPHVILYSIDDLKNKIQQNLRGREHAAEQALRVIHQKSREFMAWQQSMAQVTATIRAYRAQIQELCDAELMKALRQLEQGESPHSVLTNFAQGFTNKLLHTPSVQLRQAGLEGRLDLLQLAQQLFAIPELEIV